MLENTRLMTPVLVAALVATSLEAQHAPAPKADHHAHLLSPATAEIMRRTWHDATPLAASDLIAALDSARVRRAAVLSVAYMRGMPGVEQIPRGSDEYENVRRENDWVVQQVAPYADRLVAFCGVNPLKGYAVQEIERCARIGLKGLKLHFGNSAVDLRSPEHLERLRAVFAAANAAGFAVVVHMRTSDPSYGARDVRNFIERVLPSAPDVPVQIAHMAGWGGYDAATDAALATFAQAFESGRLARENVYFDLSAVVLPKSVDEAQPGTDLRLLADRQRDFPDWATHLAARIRTLGLDHVLFATDWPVTSAAEYQALLRERVLLEPAELRQILGNTAPYLGVGTAIPAACRADGGPGRAALSSLHTRRSGCSTSPAAGHTAGASHTSIEVLPR